MPSVLPGWNDWPSLIAAAREWPQLERLDSGVHERDLHLLLQAPVTLAWWLSEFAPQLLKRDTLDLLVVGVPGGPSSTDEGRPYQLLPALLGREGLRVNVTVLVGSAEAVPASRVPYPTPQSSLEDRGDALYPALRSYDTIAKWWELCQGKAPDACVLMQPDFDHRIDFWTGLRLLHEARVPVGCFARSEAEAERDAWMLSAYGYDVTARTRRNPWAQRWAESRGHGAWGAVAWSFAPGVPPLASVVVDHRKLERAADAQRFLQHEFEVWNPLEYIGQRIDESRLQGSDAVPPLIGLPDHHALSLATGDVWQMEPDGLVPVFGNTKLPQALLATYPSDTACGFERLLWAVDLYRDEFRPREAAAIEALGMARAEQLKDSISQAFQGRASAAELAAFETYYTGGAAPDAATPGSEPLFDALRKRDWARAEDMLAADEALANAVDEDGRDAAVLRPCRGPSRLRAPAPRPRRRSEPSGSRGLCGGARHGQARGRRAARAAAALWRGPRPAHRPRHDARAARAALPALGGARLPARPRCRPASHDVARRFRRRAVRGGRRPAARAARRDRPQAGEADRHSHRPRGLRPPGVPSGRRQRRASFP